MTRYTKRDLRAVHLLALLLFGIGLLLATCAVMVHVRPPVHVAWPRLAEFSWMPAIVVFATSAMLQWKVRQLVRNRGEEPEEYAGVPE